MTSAPHPPERSIPESGSLLRRAVIRTGRTIGLVGGAIPGVYMVGLEPVVGRFTGHVTATTRSGGRLRLDLSDFVQRKTYFRSYERRELAFLRRHLRRTDVMIDIGANVGILTIEAAGCIDQGGLVVACEPVPRNAAALRLNAELNRSKPIIVAEVAVGETTGTLHIGINDAQRDIGNFGSYTANTRPGSETIEVPMVTLDSIIDSHIEPGRRIRLLKIDVEGMEPAVIRGARRAFAEARFEFVLAEWNSAVSGDDLAVALEDAGYSVHRLGFGGRLVRPSRTGRHTRSTRPAADQGTVRSIIAWVRGDARLHTLVATPREISPDRR